ncbi:GRASP_SAV_5884, ATP-grasp ribosomal peptide maturase, SAV_5884 family [Candidatus Methylopumilus planktonicus]|uniref:hypothetical protein n=1 Tax=Candidatus Methylopumilus planktonicus TaxID=1581557 RepID=UPI003BEECE2F
MLLLITGSRDGTSDSICRKLENKVFRINYDLFNEYSLKFTPNKWQISNPQGLLITSENVTACLWWKAFNFELENQDNFVVQEVKYIFRELYAWSRLRNLTKGNPYDFHNSLGKVNLLDIASKYFIVPETLISFQCSGVKNLKKMPIVAKSLSSALTNNKASLLTTEVDISCLDPKFPWYLQEKVESDFDLTVVVCGERLFAYEKTRKNLKGLDWRGEQNFDPDIREWSKFDLTHEERNSIERFCKDIKVDWGRIDFMKRDGELVFLEYNANGQWMFLDYHEEDGILACVLDYLLQNSH